MIRRFGSAALAALLALAPLAAAQAQDTRSIGRIFFENDQRRILEGIRQGIIDTTAAAGPTEFEPIEIPTPEFAPVAEIVTDRDSGEVIRPQDLSVSGYLRNHKSGDLRLAVGADIYTERNVDYLNSLGLKVVQNAGGGVSVIDALTEQSHPVSRGSIISRRGGVTDGGGVLDRFIIVKR